MKSYFELSKQCMEHAVAFKFEDENVKAASLKVGC